MCTGETLRGAGCDGRFLTAITRAARLACPDGRQQFGQGYYLKTEFVSKSGHHGAGLGAFSGRSAGSVGHGVMWVERASL